MARRVLLLAYMFPPIVDGGAFRPTAFAKYLPEFGYEPIVLSRPDSGDLPLDQSQLDRLPPGVRIERVPLGFVDGWNEHFRRRMAWLRPLESVLGKKHGWAADAVAWRVARRDPIRQWEIAWGQQAYELSRRIIETARPDFIIASGPPFESLKTGWRLSAETGIPLIADFRDPWTYGILWNPTTARRARVEEDWENRVVRDAQYVLVVTPSMRRAMIEKYPERAAAVHMIMNGYEDFAPSNATPPADRFVASFVGTIMERRLTPVLFEALRRFRDRHPEAANTLHVQLIGPSQASSPIGQRLDTEGLTGLVQYLGPVGHYQCRELMRASHVLLHIEPTVSYAVSSKVFEYLTAKRPILGIVPRGSDDELFLQQSGAGENVGVDDADLLESTLYRLWEAWRTGTLSVSVDETWLGQFHRREQTRKLASLLDETATQRAVG